MAKFIKLTNIILNTNNISKISILPNKYCIHIMYNKLDGFLWLLGGFGLGNITSHNTEIEVCESKNPIDYKIVSEWINKN